MVSVWGRGGVLPKPLKVSLSNWRDRKPGPKISKGEPSSAHLHTFSGKAAGEARKHSVPSQTGTLRHSSLLWLRRRFSLRWWGLWRESAPWWDLLKPHSLLPKFTWLLFETKIILHCHFNYERLFSPVATKTNCTWYTLFGVLPLNGGVFWLEFKMHMVF